MMAQTYIPQALFTVTLGELIESGYDIGLSHYPIFDEQYREPLNKKITAHYYFREIGFETPALFRRFMERRMNEIMSYYNKLYKSELLDINPLINSDMTTTGDSKANATSSRDFERNETSNTTASTTAANSTDNNARTLVSTTPQMQLSGNEDYASNITDSKSLSNATSDNESKSNADALTQDKTQDETNTTENYITHVAGLSGITQSAALTEFRNTFLNIDMMVIEDLSTLFMGLYSNYMNDF